jgi:diguanylate cyclase (GGDEF)-like protein
MNICHDYNSKHAWDRNPAEEVVALRKLVKRLTEANRILSAQLETDLLTGLLNRRGLERILRRESRIAQRSNNALACAVVDLDNFKQINDRYGHATGDAMLKAVADRLLASLRSSDYIARVGGDEFIIFLPDTDLKTGMNVLRRCTENIAGSPLLSSPQPIHMTISCGVCTIIEVPATLELVLTQTKAALKHSKQTGKNRVCADPISAPPSLLEFSPLMQSFGEYPPMAS